MKGIDEELEVRIGIRVSVAERKRLGEAAAVEGSISTVIRRLLRKEFTKRKTSVNGLVP